MAIPEFVAQNRLARYFNVSTRTMGQWLREIGLRTIYTKSRLHVPTGRAFQYGYAKKVCRHRSRRTSYLWHDQKTVQALLDAGFTAKPPRKRRKAKTRHLPTEETCVK